MYGELRIIFVLKIRMTILKYIGIVDKQCVNRSDKSEREISISSILP